MTTTPPQLDPATASAVAALTRQGAVLVGVGLGVALLLGPVPIAIGILLLLPAPVIGWVLIAVGVLGAAGGIALMIVGTMRLRRRAVLLQTAGAPTPRPSPALWITQIVLGALLVGLGLLGVGLANLAASIESPSMSTVVSAWMLAAAGLLGGCGLIVLGVVALVRFRRGRGAA